MTLRPAQPTGDYLDGMKIASVAVQRFAIGPTSSAMLKGMVILGRSTTPSNLCLPSRPTMARGFAFGGISAEVVEHVIAPLLVGPKEQIGKVAGKAKVDVSPYEVVAAADAEESASVAANLAGSGKAGALMKGSLHTDQYMHNPGQRTNASLG